MRKSLLFVLALLAATAIPVLEGQAPAAEPEINMDSGLAIHGYDPVAYFRWGEPREGLEEYALEWKGAVWRFVDQENLDAFRAEPEAHAPQYGGYCAWAVSKGYLADIDPRAWTIYKDKLYLNYSLSVREQWNEQRQASIAKADANWPGVLE